MRFAFLLLILWTSTAQSQLAKRMDFHSVEADRFVGYDKFGFSYLITNNTLSKSNGALSVQYQNVALGKITTVDLVNPLRIVLFYGDFNTVVMLDNQLNEIGQINFSKLTDPIVVGATGNASQNRLWFFDTVSRRIGLYDYLSNDLLFLTQPLSGLIRYSESDFNSFQWLDANTKRFVIDVYGKIRELPEIPENEALRFVSETAVIYLRNGQIYYVDTKSAPKKLIEIDPKTFRSFWYKDQILAIFTDHTITNYKITLP